MKRWFSVALAALLALLPAVATADGLAFDQEPAVELEEAWLQDGLALEKYEEVDLELDLIEASEDEPEVGLDRSNPADDFEIDAKGMLVAYHGAGGDVVIPNGVKSIGPEAFYRCKSLKSVVIPKGVKRIADGYNSGAFSGCTNLKSVTLPKGLKSIGGAAFFGCKRLKSIDIPKGVTTIGSNAFGESGLTSVEIPEGVTDIYDSAFSECGKLKSISLPDSLKEISICSFYGSGLTEVTIPKGVEYVDCSAFERCANLKRVVIEEGVVTIGSQAFDSPNLETIVIPRSVTGISDDYAIGNGRNLTIYGYAKTEAQRYAKRNKISFVELSKVIPKATAFTSAKGGKQRIELKWKKVSKADGYEIQYAREKNFSDAVTVKVTPARTTSRTVKNLKKKKTYYVRIRTFKKEKDNTWYSDWSETKKVKTR